MTPQQLNAMKLALEALEWIAAQRTGGMIQRKAMEPIVAIREVLKDHAMQEVQRLGQEIEQERTWVGLTKQQQLDIFAQSVAKKRSEHEHYMAIEQALKERNQ